MGGESLGSPARKEIDAVKVPLDSVTFSSDVRGPGERVSSHMGKTFVSMAYEAARRKDNEERKREHVPDMKAVELDYDPDLSAVVLRKAGAKMHDTVFVPWALVVSCEPSNLEKLTAPAKK